MMMEENKLEATRAQLYEQLNNKKDDENIVSGEVLRLSQELDVLILDAMRRQVKSS